MFADCKIRTNSSRNEHSPNPFGDKWLNLEPEDRRTNLSAIRSIGLLYGRYFHCFRTKSPRPLHYVVDWVIYFPLYEINTYGVGERQIDLQKGIYLIYWWIILLAHMLQQLIIILTSTTHCQKLLHRNRYPFKKNWTYIYNTSKIIKLNQIAVSVRRRQ